MALTRITKGVIKPNENYDTHNINSTGIVTAIGLDVNGNGDISGNLNVGGVLTYEDVTSIDSVGIITAQKDIHVGAGISAVGIGTFGGLDINGDIDVDGHTELDNVNVAGIATFIDRVGICTSNMTAHANADDLIVGSSTGSHAGITIRAGGTGETNIFFADSDSGLGSYQGIIQYAHQANQFNIFTDGLQRVRIQNGGGIQLISSTPTSTNIGWTVFGGDSTSSYSTLNTHFPTTNRMMLMAGHPSNESSFVVWNKGDANTAKGFGINNAGIFKYVHGASELVRFQPDGNVGIASAIPEQRLTVAGATDITHYPNTTVNNNRLQLGFNAPEGYLKVKNSTGSPAANLALYTTDTSGNTNRVMHCNYLGNVGIATNNPTGILDIISNSGTYDHLRLRRTSSGAGDSDWSLKPYAGNLYFRTAGANDKITFTSGGVVTATSFSGSGANLTGIDTDLVSDTSPQLGGDLASNGHDLKFADASGYDGNQIYMGSDNDVRIHHDGSNFSIAEATGDITIQSADDIFLKPQGGENGIRVIGDGAVELYHNNTKRLETTSSGVEIPQALFVGEKIDMPDHTSGTTGMILLGTGDDLYMYHDGTNSHLRNNTGTFNVRATNFRLTDAAIQHVYLKTNDSGNNDVQLYYDNSKKFETTSNGVKVTGTGLALNVDGGYIRSVGGGPTVVAHKSSSTFCHIGVENNTNARAFLAYTNDKDFIIGRRTAYTGDHTGYSGRDISIDKTNHAVELCYNGGTRFATTNEGATFSTGSTSCVVRLTSNNSSEHVLQAYNNDLNIKAPSSGGISLITNGSSERLRITSDGGVNVLGPKLKLPTGTSNPSSSVTGDSYYNTSDGTFKIYDGSVWGSVLFAAAGTQQNPATSATNLGATGALAQYYFKPNTGDTAFQQYACGGLSNLGTIPSGGPSWVSSHSSLIIIEKGQIGTTTTMKMSQANYGKFIKESITRNSGTTPYVYWAVFDGGTLWGIWRIRWTGATYSTWISNHNFSEGVNTAPSGTPSSDVWKTGSGTAGGTISTGSYTVSNNNNLNRAVLPEQNYNNGGSWGIHYKRLNTGEHYPWRNSSGNYTSNGYFQPSTSYAMGTDTRYVHYIYLADN